MDYNKYLSLCNREFPYISYKELKGKTLCLLEEPKEPNKTEYQKNMAFVLKIDILGIGKRRVDFSKSQFEKFILYAQEKQLQINQYFRISNIKKVQKHNIKKKNCKNYIIEEVVFTFEYPIDITKIDTTILQEEETNEQQCDHTDEVKSHSDINTESISRVQPTTEGDCTNTPKSDWEDLLELDSPLIKNMYEDSKTNSDLTADQAYRLYTKVKSYKNDDLINFFKYMVDNNKIKVTWENTFNYFISTLNSLQELKNKNIESKKYNITPTDDIEKMVEALQNAMNKLCVLKNVKKKSILEDPESCEVVKILFEKSVTILTKENKPSHVLLSSLISQHRENKIIFSEIINGPEKININIEV